MTSAVSAGVPNALLLSVINGSPPRGADNATSIGSYFALENLLRARWHRGSFTVLRTFFYQQNLLLWAHDVRAHAGSCQSTPFLAPVRRFGGPVLAQRSQASIASVVAHRSWCRQCRERRCLP